MEREANVREATQGFAVRRTPTRSRKPLFLKTGAVLLTLALCGAGLWWLRTSPTFAVKRVESGAYRFTSRQELEDTFACFLGRNIWTLSSDDVADSLSTLPWVRDLNVHRRLPGSIEVDFREWRPLLVIEPNTTRPGGQGQPLAVVEDGRVLQFPDHLVLPGLPVLVGVAWGRDSASGALCLDPAQKATVLDLVAAVEASGLESASPVDFIVARSEGFAIVLQDGRGSLLVGREDFADRLERYMTARDHLEAGLQMDLRFADRITCRRI